MNKSSLRRGIKYYRSGRYKQAIDELLQVDEDPYENPELSFYLGLAYTRLEKLEEALLYLEQAITAGIDLLHLYQARMVLGYIYTITNRHKLALFEFNELVEAGYESPQVYSIMGYIAFEQKKWDLGIEYAEKAHKLDPENTNALNSLGYMLAERGIRLDEALEYCKRAVTADPRNPAYLDSLGWVQFKLGKINEARLYLRKALDSAPGNKTIAGHLRSLMNQ